MEFTKFFESLGIPQSVGTLSFRVTDSSLVFLIDKESEAYLGKNEINLPISSILTEFSNIKQMYKNGIDEIKRGVNAINESYHQIDKGYVNALYKFWCSKCSSIVAWILTLMYCRMRFSRKDFWGFFNVYVDVICNGYVDGKVSGLKSEIMFTSILVPNNKGDVFLFFETKDVENVVLFDLYKSAELHIKPKRCKNCGKAFLPATRSDEIYCRNEYKNGRTCSQIAFEIKSKENPFYTEYRKAYKTMKARAARASDNKRFKEKISQWAKKAAAKQIEFERLGDIDGYKAWIEQSKQI
jgi:ribosomal protein L31